MHQLRIQQSNNNDTFKIESQKVGQQSGISGGFFLTLIPSNFPAQNLLHLSPGPLPHNHGPSTGPATIRRYQSAGCARLSHSSAGSAYPTEESRAPTEACDESHQFISTID